MDNRDNFYMREHPLSAGKKKKKKKISLPC